LCQSEPGIKKRVAALMENRHGLLRDLRGRGAERDAALLRASQVSGVKLVILERTTQHPAAISQKKYKPIEESFGWMTTGV
jgi:hypothetical protein